MVKYLQLEGTTSGLKVELLTFDEVIMEFKARQVNGKYYFDARAGVSNTYLYHTGGNDVTSGSGQFPAGMYWDGISVVNNTPFIPYDTRGILRLVLNADSTDDVTFFQHNTSTTSGMEADVYDVKLLLNGVTVAHYDMSTGTVQDQSGNGNHATLTGGTWLDDGTGGDTGTEVTSSYTSKQSIYHVEYSSYASKQSIYMPQSGEFASELIIYKTDTSDYQTKQTISKDIDTSYSTSQVITLVGGREVTTLFPTKQQISLVRRSDFDTQQIIKGRFYKTLNLSMSTRSEVKLNTTLEDTMIEVVVYIGQTVYQPNPLRTVSEMEVMA